MSTQRPKSITDRIKTIQDAINELGEPDVEVAELRKLENATITSHILYRQQAVVITKALNEDWVPDFSNLEQTKYEPWFEYDSSADGFLRYNYLGRGTSTDVGSRLCFKSRELAEYFGKQFIEIHRKYLK